MKLYDSDRRLARELCGLAALDFCPVVIAGNRQAPLLVGVEGHYVDRLGQWIHTAYDMARLGPEGRRYVPATRAIEVSAVWVLRVRRSPYGFGKRVQK